jgi:hypothetical protein
MMTMGPPSEARVVRIPVLGVVDGAPNRSLTISSQPRTSILAGNTVIGPD